MTVGAFQESGPVIWNQGLFEISATQKHRLGVRRALADGRVFEYSKAGGSNLAAGKLNQAAAPVANHLNCKVAAAAAIGATRVSVTLGNTAAVANEYKEGYLSVNDADGEGVMYKIRGHKAINAAGTGWFELYDPIRDTALTTSSEVTLTKHPADGLIVLPTTATSIVTGIAPVAVTAAYYFWNQVYGPAVCLVDGTIVIGQHVRISDGVAGAVEPLDRDGSAEDELQVGRVLRVNATTEYGLIFLDL